MLTLPNHLRLPVVTPRSLLQRPGTARRSAAQDSRSPATPASATPPVLLPSPQPTTPGPPPPPPSTQPPRLPAPVVRPDDDPHLRSCVECYTYIDWAREQRNESPCSATLRFISLGSLSPPPDELLDYISSTRRPLFSEVIGLAAIGQLHTTDDDNVHFVHRPYMASSRQVRTITPQPLT